MNTTIIIIAIVMTLIVGGGMALPFWVGRREKDSSASNANSTAYLKDQLGQVINAVRDLDFDFDTGKVTEADYVEHRKLLIGRGVSLLIRLDETLAEQRERDSEIEDWIATYRHQSA